MQEAGISDQMRSGAFGLSGSLWLIAGVLACLSVILINGGALFYYDSPAYLEQGTKILDLLGLTTPVADGTGVAGVAADNDQVVNGTRSVIYSLIAAVAVAIGGLSLVAGAHLLLVAIGLWLPLRILARESAWHQSPLELVGVALVAAAAGSLPFYTAYVMPDILTGILLLMISILAIFSQRMTTFELFLAFGMGAFCVVSHISHIAVAAALIPVVALAALLVSRKRWWVAPLLVLAMVLVGFGERKAFNTAAKVVADSEVVYSPFLTARLIEDGPGLRYLEQTCPNEGLASCALFDALSKSDDPMRLTASHIIFERQEHLGSFMHLETADQAAVAGEQYRFFFKVLKAEPIGTTLAIVKNTLKQAGMNSIEMTIPTNDIVALAAEVYPNGVADFPHGRLSVDRNWVPSADKVHSLVYTLSLIVLVYAILRPSHTSVHFRNFVIVVLLSILANAFVCGAVSQPADRYGARVIWLLPALAGVVMFLIFSRGKRKVL